MSDNQLSVWVADFPKEVLILLKFIRKLLKHLSRMLISSQKAFVNCIMQIIFKVFIEFVTVFISLSKERVATIWTIIS